MPFDRNAFMPRRKNSRLKVALQQPESDKASMIESQAGPGVCGPNLACTLLDAA
jgi:hypothetical protein